MEALEIILLSVVVVVLCWALYERGNKRLKTKIYESS